MFSEQLVAKLITQLKTELGIDVVETDAQNICLRLAQFTYSKLSVQERSSK